jgi:phenylalanyl-tRNA synthetase beta chain
MKISYNWLKDYLPDDEIMSKMVKSLEKLSDVLTSVGLEVESLEYYEEIKGSLSGLTIGEVIVCENHPDADKLKITTVDNGKGETLQIVCGANNVASGQKVVIASVGTTLYPINGEPLVIKKAKIRGIESNGMICAEDEIGIGESHSGIIVLPDDAETGMTAFDFFKPYIDWIFEIGLTPNRMNAMSHIGVAKDICAYLAHHNRAEIKMISPFNNNFKSDNTSSKIKVSIENEQGCGRYAGVSISGIKLSSSPVWLQNRLKSIGVRPINNIIDITNFILHETGQPLHAFDADKIKRNSIIIKTLPDATKFITLDEKVRSLNAEDIMVCNGNGEPMCFGGIFGGLESGVTKDTVSIFLESAWFNPAFVRKTSFRHNLRTEAAIRFEKGVDIGNTVNVLKRAALLIIEICGGQISSEIIDIYPVPKKQPEITLQNHYLKKISGKNYHRDTVKNILKSLNFSIIKEGIDEIRVAAPFSNPDITLPADVIEEIMRIDGLDNIEIPATIKMTPSIETGADETALKEKVASWLTANGFSEIFTNSITNSKYFDEKVLSKTVKIINSLSEDLNVMRPSLMPTGLESIAYNINRKNADLLFFEFGKVYAKPGQHEYVETESLAIYFTGNKKESDWRNRGEKTGIYFAKGVCNIILKLAGVNDLKFSSPENDFFNDYILGTKNGNSIAEIGTIKKSVLEKFSIKQPVFYLYINWQQLLSSKKIKGISFEEIPKFPKVQRDLSIIVDKSVSYQLLEESVKTLKISKLKEVKLFDVFESEKIGTNKKSMAISFTFSDKEKTLTDNETDAMMNKIINSIEKNMTAEIRRNN